MRIAASWADCARRSSVGTISRWHSAPQCDRTLIELRSKRLWSWALWERPTPGWTEFWGCFVYVLAKLGREPILAKGNDFPLTDIGVCGQALADMDLSVLRRKLLGYSPLPSASVISVFCSSSCALADPVAGVAFSARLMLRTFGPRIFFSRGTTNDSAPMF